MMTSLLEQHREFMARINSKRNSSAGLGDMVKATLSAVGVTEERAKPGPSLLTKAANFATSAVRHVAAGMPRASEEEVARRFAICQACELYDGMACRKCGCPIVREKRFVSKLSWANESCPVGKWGREMHGSA